MGLVGKEQLNKLGIEKSFWAEASKNNCGRLGFAEFSGKVNNCICTHTLIYSSTLSLLTVGKLTSPSLGFLISFDRNNVLFIGLFYDLNRTGELHRAVLCRKH